MLSQDFIAGKKYARLVMLSSGACFLLTLSFAAVYYYLIAAEQPEFMRRSSLFTTAGIGVILSAVIIGAGLIFKSYIRYELTETALRISKGRLLRVIYRDEVAEIRDIFSKNGKKRSLSIVLKNGSGIAVNSFIEDPEGLEKALRVFAGEKE